jgi:hypothetical protein
MAHDVFISYSTKDKPMADAVCATLESNGVRCWIAPRDIQPGADWGEAIVNAIEGSKLFILIFSGNANESPQVKRELQHGFEAGVLVIPFRVENILPNKALDYYLGSVHWLDAITTPFEKHLETLTAKTKSVLGNSPAGAEDTKTGTAAASGATTVFSSTTKESSASTALWAVVVSVVVVGVIVVYAVYRMTMDKKPAAPASVSQVAVTPTPAPTPAPVPPVTTQAAPVVVNPPPVPAPAAAAVDPALVDTWQVRFPSPTGDAVVTWAIHADGSYSGTQGGSATPASETGHVTFSKNAWTLISDKGRQDQGTYVITDANDVVITGTAGSALWTRLSAAEPIQQTVDPMIIGSWQLSAANMTNAVWICTVDSDGRYAGTLSMNGTVVKEAGHLDFGNLVWSLRSDAGREDHGSYLVTNQNLMTLTGEKGSSTWTRIGKGN